jgi:uncharacterized protein YueI
LGHWVFTDLSKRSLSHSVTLSFHSILTSHSECFSARNKGIHQQTFQASKTPTPVDAEASGSQKSKFSVNESLLQANSDEVGFTLIQFLSFSPQNALQVSVVSAEEVVSAIGAVLAELDKVQRTEAEIEDCKDQIKDCQAKIENCSVRLDQYPLTLAHLRAKELQLGAEKSSCWTLSPS